MNSDGMRQLLHGFEKLGLSSIPSAGNFVCVDLGRPAAPAYEALLREGVIVRPVANYGMPHHLRVTRRASGRERAILESPGKVLGTKD